MRMRSKQGSLYLRVTRDQIEAGAHLWLWLQAQINANSGFLDNDNPDLSFQQTMGAREVARH
jgi:hypothetical protein